MSVERNLIETVDYVQSRGFGQKVIRAILLNNNIIGMGISRGAEWHIFQLRSTFQ